ncbi:peptidase C14 [Aphanothece hegewaldii CCALA 016]|uniref:Peptidase C14 n=1 Tax=Aphanothece hegewaldii CCALA 016 TaxID=2107694 RepID=A0A2T1LZD3_9CHRO|nr:caspase domain-containing protein [Aphanothece hegewaldii]PSF37743.1 peptidase C14 [Aphanothece hegewaldii CCALA 016]
MPPISISTSRFTLALETGQAKLWVLLVGVNEYYDQNLPPLRYSALDCQGLGEALNDATQTFPQKEIIIHHDLAEQKPFLQTVKASLERIVTEAKTQDTVLFYFSGHGLLDPESQQTILCLTDTNKENLLETGLTLQDLLVMFNRCAAHCQVVWLDACHCGNMTLTGARGELKESLLPNPTTQLLEALRKRAAKSKGFYALLSCDQGQQSWEFPDLGHGVFSYYLMRGLRGEAANSKGVIEADGLYRYVYNQTLQYIEKANQQLRLINQQKRHRGEPQIYSEYSMQTPKRIVEGVGELILGLKKNANDFNNEQRHALMIEGLAENQTSIALKEVFEQEGYFTVTKISTSDKPESVKNTIQNFLQYGSVARPNPVTLLLYLRGRLEVDNKGESYLVLENGIRLERSWLRKELRRCKEAQQIVILDGYGEGSIEEWLEELKTYADHGQCLLGSLAPAEDVELFAQILLESLIAANPQIGLSVAEWLTKLQTNCEQLGITFSAWLSGIHGVIDILPGKIEESLQKIPQTPVVEPLEKPLVKPVPLVAEKTSLPPTPPTQTHRSFSPKQYAILTQFLTELIGPVALTLLNSVGDETSSISVFLDNLSQYLSPSQKIKLDKWANSMVEKPELLSLDQPQPQSKEATNTNILPEQYTQLESILREIIGPIASMLLKQISAQTQQSESLIANIKDYLTPSQKAQFETQVYSLFSKNEQPPIIEEQPKETTSTKLDEKMLHQCEQELTQLIGPIAQFIITTTLQKQPQITRNEFIELISTEIPNQNQAIHFRQRWMTK